MYQFYNTTSDDIVIGSIKLVPGSNSISTKCFISIASDPSFLSQVFQSNIQPVIGDQNIKGETAMNWVLSVARSSNFPKDFVPRSTQLTSYFKPRGLIFTAAGSSVTTYWYKFTADLAFRGGTMYSTGSIGDSITISLVDKDNIMGQGANYVIGVYADSIYVFPNASMEILELSISDPLSTGLYFKIDYTNTIITPCKVILNLFAYEFPA